MDDFSKSFDNADFVILTDIYARVRQTPVK